MSEETEKLIVAALNLGQYATHDNDCGANIGEPCDCGYSCAHRHLHEVIAEAERAAIANQIHALTGARSVTVMEMDLSQDGEVTPTGESYRDR